MKRWAGGGTCVCGGRLCLKMGGDPSGLATFPFVEMRRDVWRSLSDVPCACFHTARPFAQSCANTLAYPTSSLQDPVAPLASRTRVLCLAARACALFASQLLDGHRILGSALVLLRRGHRVFVVSLRSPVGRSTGLRRPPSDVDPHRKIGAKKCRCRVRKKSFPPSPSA